MNRIVCILVLALYTPCAAQPFESNYEATQGVPQCDFAEPYELCWSDDNGDWPLNDVHEIVAHPDDGLPTLYVEDFVGTTYTWSKHPDWGTYVDCPVDDDWHDLDPSVCEFEAQTLSGTWSAGFFDFHRSFMLTMEVDRVGVRDFDGTWLTFATVDNSDSLHVYRIEKYDRDFVRFYMDELLLFEVDFCQLFDVVDESIMLVFGGSTLAHVTYGDDAEFYVREYRHLLGATSFPDDPLPWSWGLFFDALEATIYD